MQTELTQTSPLLDHQGNLNQIGWVRHPILACNLQDTAFYPWLLQPLQFARIKRLDYYALFTPNRFFSVTIADLGYAGNVFVYTLDIEGKNLHEEGLVIPLGRGVTLSEQTTGRCEYHGQGVTIKFQTSTDTRDIFLDWPEFHAGRGIQARICLHQPVDHQSMNIVIPIPKKRFYYNHKINCLPATGYLKYGDLQEEHRPDTSLGQLDWGRGVWEYSSLKNTKHAANGLWFNTPG